MLRDSVSRKSMTSAAVATFRPNKIDSLQLCQQIQNTLEEASKCLLHHEFAPIYERTIKNLIIKGELESISSQSVILSTLNLSLAHFDGSLELTVRVLLFQILSEINCGILEEVEPRLEKAKHLVLGTKIEYLLTKIFILESRYWRSRGEDGAALKALKKCIELNEEHMLEFMQQQEDVRKEIVDYAIICYYQFFKMVKEQRPGSAIQMLMKACTTATKSYGPESKIVAGLRELYREQQVAINSIEKMSSKSRAITDIFQCPNKKNGRVVAFYSWEDEKIVVQLLKVRGKEKQVVSQNSYDIKLDMCKIKLLKNSEWLTIQKGEISINQDELLRILGVGNNNFSQQKQMMTTGIGLRELSREQIFKKAFMSSSDDDQEVIFSKEGIRCPRFPRAQSSRQFKKTQ